MQHTGASGGAGMVERPEQNGHTLRQPAPRGAFLCDRSHRIARPADRRKLLLPDPEKAEQLAVVFTGALFEQIEGEPAEVLTPHRPVRR